jgi:hypothetical protein
MKGKRIEYEKIEQLPSTALSVAAYAQMNKITVSYVYKLFKLGRIKIVDFQGYNFVV